MHKVCYSIIMKSSKSKFVSVGKIVVAGKGRAAKDKWLKEKLGKQKMAKDQAQRATNTAANKENKRDERGNRTPKEHFIFGKHAVEAAIRRRRRKVNEVFTYHDGLPKLFSSVKVTPVDRAYFDSFGDVVHQGFAASVGPLPPVGLEDILGARLLLVLDQVSDPHNFGAILRSADAFGVGGVLVPPARSAAITDVVAKTAAGALETVPIVEMNLAQGIKTLQTEGYWVVGLDGATQETISHVETNADTKIALVLGSEGQGLRPLVAKSCDQLVKLPMVGTVESLNVSVAAGVALFALGVKKGA